VLRPIYSGLYLLRTWTVIFPPDGWYQWYLHITDNNLSSNSCLITIVCTILYETVSVAAMLARRGGKGYKCYDRSYLETLTDYTYSYIWLYACIANNDNINCAGIFVIDNCVCMCHYVLVCHVCTANLWR